MAKRAPFVAVGLILCAACAVAFGQDDDPPPVTKDVEEARIDDRPAQAGADDPATQAMLDRALPEVTFDGVGLSDVIDFLRDLTNANIFVNWRALEGAGIDRNAPVNLRLRQVKFSKALQLILDGVGGDEVRLGYTVDDGVITISTDEDLGQNTLTRVYDVRDIADAKVADAAAAGDAKTARAKRLAALTTLVTGSVAPDSWRGTGGDGGTGGIRELDGQLVVTQTPANHDAIVNLLKQTRVLLGLPPAEDPAPIAPEPQPKE